jgi:uncharacterized protein (TIGR00255 family)
MIRSMTGYGAASLETDTLRASITIRSLNHRFLELALHVPRRLAALEPEIKALVQSRVKRGRVELSLQASLLRGEGELVVVSQPLVNALVRTLREVRDEQRLDGGVSVSDVVRFPGALEVLEPSEGADAARVPLLELVARALDGLEAMRRAEGENLAGDLAAGLDAIAAATERLASLSEAGKAERREALTQKVRELATELGLDDARLYLEVVRQTERADVTEETQRLRSHVQQFRELMGAQEPTGKRLDFLAQELMREANTLGSKSSGARLIQEVVGFKSLIEQLREQVQNVE